MPKNDAIAQLEHALFVARSKATRGDLSRATDMQQRALAKARASTAKTAVDLGQDVGRSNKGCIPCAISVRTSNPFGKATSGRTSFYKWNDKIFGGKHKIRVCRV